MHRTKLQFHTLLLSVLISTLVSFAAVMCIFDAYELYADPPQLLMAACILSAAASCAMVPRRTWFMTLLAAVLFLALLIWQREPVEKSFLGLLYQITGEFAICFDGITIYGSPADCQPVLLTLMVPLTWITAWVVCREGNVILLLLACTPIFFLCLIIVDIAPVFWLILLTFALLLLLVTYSVRERSANEGSRLIWWIILPSSILITSITVLWPPADYDRADWSQALQMLAESQAPVRELRRELFSNRAGWHRDLKEEDLAALGPKTLTGRKVLAAKAAQSDYYLRGVSLGIYENNTWSAVPSADYDFETPPTYRYDGQSDTLQIHTLRGEEVFYTTYFHNGLPESAQFVDDAYIKNKNRLLDYTIPYGETGYGVIPEGYSDFVRETYTAIPESMEEPLYDLILENQWYRADTPEELALWIQVTGTYDLNTPTLPEGEEFVLYFLENGQRGYCVHFATATAMVLRAMGLPTRYVTGYLVHGEAGQWTDVTEDHAHAWVEYWTEEGWIPLDPTPPYDLPEPTEPEPEAPEEPEPPEPPKPEAPKEPEAPPQPMEPEKKPIPKALLWSMAVPALVLLLWLRRLLTLRRRSRHCKTGDPNRRALTQWHWLTRLDRAAGTEPDKSTRTLAEKARFSQHTLTEEELSILTEAIETKITGLQTGSWFKRLYHRYILVLY